MVVNTGTLSLSSQETLEIPTSDFRYRQTIALKLNSLNNKKAKYESYQTFLLKCHYDKIIPNGLSVYVESLPANQDKTFVEI